MRLDKYLADMSIGTRNEVKDIIRHKRVKVNDEVIKDPSFQIVDDMVVMVDEKIINYVDYEYYILNKPQGYITANEDNRYPVVMELINSKRKDLSPIGRLDLDTEGLLLISNDGKLNHALLSPKNHVEKKYYVEVDNDMPDNAKEVLESPIDLGDFITKGAKFEKINKRSSYLTICEGKFHQVKRMYEKIGVNVTYLKRVSFAFLTLDNLDVKEYRSLTKEEIKKLRELI